ncbi:aldo/keto reductase [Kiritimatiellaeota bacterium B1221]|nr:aldo/keto reductase [Kiritimatiellaeota bacterium B1221]
MKTIPLGLSSLEVSSLALGCMRMGPLNIPDACDVLQAARDVGITFFDHADIYNQGGSEKVFAGAVKEMGLRREDIHVQSKCGIRKGFFDFSKKHILNSVDGILSRLETAYLDVLLLHRPDALMEPEEIAEAFAELKSAGKVRHFGVSNQNPTQIAFLQQALEMPLVANQMQFSIAHTPMIDQGLNVNMADEPAVNRDGGVLDYCQLHKITVQPWSPLQAGFFGGVFLDHPDYAELNEVLKRIAMERDVPVSAVAIAWLLRHPAKMQPILGSMNPQRIKDMAEACEFKLSRPEWYEIYRAAENRLP